MTAKQLDDAMKRLYGEGRGNQAKLAAALGMNRSTIGRYLSDEIPIPEVVAVAVRSLTASAA